MRSFLRGARVPPITLNEGRRVGWVAKCLTRSEIIVLFYSSCTSNRSLMLLFFQTVRNQVRVELLNNLRLDEQHEGHANHLTLVRYILSEYFKRSASNNYVRKLMNHRTPTSLGRRSRHLQTRLRRTEEERGRQGGLSLSLTNPKGSFFCDVPAALQGTGG